MTKTLVPSGTFLEYVEAPSVPSPKLVAKSSITLAKDWVVIFSAQESLLSLKPFVEEQVSVLSSALKSETILRKK